MGQSSLSSKSLTQLSTYEGSERKISKETFTQKKVDVSDLRVFGSRVFVHIPKHNHDKMGAKAVHCILLGMEEVTKGYQCYCPNTKRNLVSRDVIFDKSNKGELKEYRRTSSNSDHTPTTIFTPNPQLVRHLCHRLWKL